MGATTEPEKLNQLKLKYEQELERRIETMLDPVLGPGKVVVRSNVDVNLQETQMTKEEFDPDNRVVRSQRRTVDDSGVKPGGTPGVQANIPGGDATKTGDSSSSKRSSEAVTYEVGRTTSRISEPRGQVQKISVAVLVNGTYDKNKYISRTTEEMEVIKGMVKRAVGFDSERGDEIDVANVPFKVQPTPGLQPTAVPDLKDMVTSPTGIGIGVGALVGVGLLVFLLMRRKPKKKEAGQPTTIIEPDLIVTTPQKVQEEVAVASEKIILSDDPRKEQLSQIARDYHDATVRIIRMWLQEETNKARTGSSNGVSAEVSH